jgi:Universal stress protein family
VEKSEQVILVGVTGPGENTAALRFAAEEAARLGAAVCIVHAVHDVIPPPAAKPLISYQVPWNEVANRVVSEAVEEFRALCTRAPSKRRPSLVTAGLRCVMLDEQQLAPSVFSMKSEALMMAPTSS